MAGFTNETALCTNIQVDGDPQGAGSFNANGQLLIGGVATPNMSVAVPTGSNGVALTLGQNSIDVAGINASTAQVGVVTLADDAEAIAGTDTSKAIVPTSLKAKLGSQTANGLAYGGGDTQAVNWLAAATDGQIPIGSTGMAPVLATLTAGSNISITNAAGSITIDSTASGGGITWNVVTADTTMAPDEGYILTGATDRDFTLPATAAVGTILAAAAFETGKFTIVQNAGQDIRFGTGVTTTGVGGSIESSNPGDAIKMVCVVADTSWMVVSSQGNAFVVI